MSTHEIQGATIESDNPRRIRVTWDGRVTEDSVRALQNFSHERRADLGPEPILQCLVVAKDGAQVDPNARQALTTRRGRERPWDRLAVVSARFEARVIVELIVRALRTLKREMAEVRFFDAEAEAIAWLERP